MTGERKGIRMWQVVLLCVVVAVLAVAVSCAIFMAGNDMIGSGQSLGQSNGEQVVYVSEKGDAVSVGQKVSPSVVFINNIVRLGNQNNGSLWDMFGYGGYYGGGTYSDSYGDAEEEQISSTGSGVIYSKDGYIITNYHVVEGADKISVTLYDGTEYLADVVGTDATTDLAVLKIEGEKLVPAEFADSDNLVVGEMAVAIGNPGGAEYQNSLTQGVVSGLNRYMESRSGNSMSLIQTDAAVNPGNSGGPLCNGAGEVIGINTVKISAEAYEGMSFAIPSNTVLNICDQLIKDGKVARPALQVGIYAEISKQMAYYYKLPVDYGILVKPQAEGAAEKAGMKDQDIIIAIDDIKVETASDLQDYIYSKNIGDIVKVTVQRGEEQLNLRVTLSKLD